MVKKLLLMFLLALMGMAGNSVKVMAQTPEPTGQWTFENADNLMAPSKGSLTMVPAIEPLLEQNLFKLAALPHRIRHGMHTIEIVRIVVIVHSFNIGLS